MSWRLKHSRVLGKPYQRDSLRSERSALWLEFERRRIHAIAQTRRRRSIGKHMAQMSVAIGATHFRADRAELGVAMLAYDRRIDWRGEAWPSRARIEFGVACEQRRSAAGAAVHPGVMIIPVFAGEHPLGAGLAQNMILIGRQCIAPFALGFLQIGRGS